MATDGRKMTDPGRREISQADAVNMRTQTINNFGGCPPDISVCLDSPMGRMGDNMEGMAGMTQGGNLGDK